MIRITLAAARVNAGLTQADVAEKMHISKNTIVNWENGKVVPSVANIHMLSFIYGIPADNIILPERLTIS